jgi:tetratricopeptide (TPR) repeat protein
MSTYFTGFLTAALILLGVQASGFAADRACEQQDTLCRSFSTFAAHGQYYKIIAQASPDGTYSAAAREMIGRAYLMMAGKETNTPEQEEIYCRKALEYGATAAYMGLYFIHAGNDAEKAIAFLKQYVTTGPRDTVPYVLLGEYELEQGRSAAAREYLLEARKVARGRSANLDWLLFQANYLLGDYAAASEMLDSAILQGQPMAELKSLMTDPRFLGIETRPEFRQFEPVIKGTSAMAAY